MTTGAPDRDRSAGGLGHAVLVAVGVIAASLALVAVAATAHAQQGDDETFKARVTTQGATELCVAGETEECADVGRNVDGVMEVAAARAGNDAEADTASCPDGRTGVVVTLSNLGADAAVSASLTGQAEQGGESREIDESVGPVGATSAGGATARVCGSADGGEDGPGGGEPVDPGAPDPGELGPGELGPGELDPGELDPGELGPGEPGPGGLLELVQTLLKLLGLDPGGGLPDDPTKELPQNPTEELPQNPTEELPQNPTEELPQNPAEELPEGPGQGSPVDPGDDAPTDPGGGLPDKPGGDAPEKPGGDTPDGPDGGPDGGDSSGDAGAEAEGGASADSDGNADADGTAAVNGGFQGDGDAGSSDGSEGSDGSESSESSDGVGVDSDDALGG